MKYKLDFRRDWKAIRLVTATKIAIGLTLCSALFAQPAFAGLGGPDPTDYGCCDVYKNFLASAAGANPLTEGNGNSGLETTASGLVKPFPPSVSANGRYVAFSSQADDLAPNDNNGKNDVFVYDSETSTVQLISATPGIAGFSGDNHSNNASISGDGRYVAFMSYATNLTRDASCPINPDMNPLQTIGCVFIRDRFAGKTTGVAFPTSPNVLLEGRNPSISAGGKHVVFDSIDNVDGTHGPYRDVYSYDIQNKSFDLISRGQVDPSANSGSSHPTVSADGRYVAFESTATNLVSAPTDTPFTTDIFLYDSLAPAGSQIEMLNVSSAGSKSDAEAIRPAISDKLKLVTFSTAAGNLDANDQNGDNDIYVRDFGTDTTTLVSQDANGMPLGIGTLNGNQYSSVAGLVPTVAFTAQNRIYLRNLGSKKTTVFDRNKTGDTPNGKSFTPDLSGNGTRVAFASLATDLTDVVPNMDKADIYFRYQVKVRIPIIPAVAAGILDNPSPPPPAGGGQSPSGSVESPGAGSLALPQSTVAKRALSKQRSKRRCKTRASRRSVKKAKLCTTKRSKRATS